MGAGRGSCPGNQGAWAALQGLLCGTQEAALGVSPGAPDTWLLPPGLSQRQGSGRGREPLVWPLPRGLIGSGVELCWSRGTLGWAHAWPRFGVVGPWQYNRDRGLGASGHRRAGHSHPTGMGTGSPALGPAHTGQPCLLQDPQGLGCSPSLSESCRADTVLSGVHRGLDGALGACSLTKILW